MLALPFPITVCLLWGISKSLLIRPSLRLSLESFCLAQSSVKCSGPKEKSCLVGSPRDTLRKEEKSRTQAVGWHSPVYYLQRLYREIKSAVLQSRSSSDGQAAKRSWDLEGLGTLPPLKYKKANKGGLQGESTFHPACGSGRGMETRRWKGSPTLEGLQSSLGPV